MSRLAIVNFFMIFSYGLWGTEQLVVVLAPEMNATFGILTRYEKENGEYNAVSSAIKVTLGRSGLGWEHGNRVLKNEGDGRSPAGVFEIASTFGYDPIPNSRMPYWHANETLICVDDVNDTRYNAMALLEPQNPPKSFEPMRREDEVYRNGAVIAYNRERVSGRGSCIFFHLNHPDGRPTAGCTAMEERPLLELIRWLNPLQKPKLLQIPQSECRNYQQEFRGINCE